MIQKHAHTNTYIHITATNIKVEPIGAKAPPGPPPPGMANWEPRPPPRPKAPPRAVFAQGLAHATASGTQVANSASMPGSASSSMETTHRPTPPDASGAEALPAMSFGVQAAEIADSTSSSVSDIVMAELSVLDRLGGRSTQDGFRKRARA